MREHACFNFRVGVILARLPISRRVLESRFQKLLGRTPHDEILRLRLHRVQQLLQETNWSIGDIAQQTGFEHAEYLSAAFKRELGQTPTQYRREMKGRPQAAGAAASDQPKRTTAADQRDLGLHP
ncbi:MAG: helix-turn-helix transcriptional regulator [Pirellulaceae bacterium]